MPIGSVTEPVGFLPDIGKALGGAVQAVGGAVGDVANGAAAAAGEVLKSPLVQTVLAVETGGLSLAAQGAWSAATGEPTPVSTLVNDIKTDPLKTLSQTPGTLISEFGATGAITTGAKAVGAGLGTTFHSGLLHDVGEGINIGQQAIKDDPVASLQVIGGGIGAAFGVAGASQVAKAGGMKLAADVAGAESKRWSKPDDMRVGAQLEVDADFPPGWHGGVSATGLDLTPEQRAQEAAEAKAAHERASKAAAPKDVRSPWQKLEAWLAHLFGKRL